jgi:hypothetical protein
MERIACPCPPDGGRHPDGDTVTFRATLPFWRVESIRSDMAELPTGSSVQDVLGFLSELYLVHGIESWTLADDDGPLAVNRPNVGEYILTRYDIAAQLAEVADQLYMEKVILPLVAKASASSQPSPTGGSTSPQPTDSTPSSESGKPSKRSSISTIPTDDTETTSASPDGDSSSSRSKASAA